MAIELISKIAPKNDGFQGMIDNDQIVGVAAGFKDEDDMASNSATAFCSQQSIKKYVDDNAGGITTNDGSVTLTFQTGTSWGSATSISSQECYYQQAGRGVIMNGVIELGGPPNNTLSEGNQLELSGLPQTPEDMDSGASINQKVGTFFVYRGLGSNNNAHGDILFQSSSGKIYFEIMRLIGTVYSTDPIHIQISYITDT